MLCLQNLPYRTLRIVSAGRYSDVSQTEHSTNYVTPPWTERVGRHIVIPLVSVCPSQNRVGSYNLKTVRDISTKLHTLEKHIQTTCYAQEPELCFGYFRSYFSLIICNAISCPLYNLISPLEIFQRNFIHLYSTFRQSVMHKNHNCFEYFWIISLWSFAMLFRVHSITWGNSRKLQIFVKHIKTTCHVQEQQLLHVYFSNKSPCNITKSNFLSALELQEVEHC